MHVVASVGKAKSRESQQTHTPLRSHGVSKDNGRIESRSSKSIVITQILRKGTSIHLLYVLD